MKTKKKKQESQFESEMARKEKVDIIRQAIKQLIDGDNNTTSLSSADITASSSGGQNRHSQILQSLLSQLDSIDVQEEQKCHPPEESKIVNASNTPEIGPNVDDNKVLSRSEEAVMKEIKDVKRQNFITQCLVSTMIVLTLVWQVSEISIALKIRGALCNPIRSLGGWFTGGNGEMNIQDAIKQISRNHKQVIENTSIPGLLPGADSSEDDDNN